MNPPLDPTLRFDHVGITVDDLERVAAFFVDLGLERDGPSAVVEGHFVSTVTGIDDARVEIVMLDMPDGGTRLELSTFLHPVVESAPQAPSATEPGLRNICFEVEDLAAVVDRVGAAGHELVGGIADYEDTYRMCYVRGPEGIIVAVAQDISSRR